jgi:tRNA(Arg) A34 adenosine deaminase TadA
MVRAARARAAAARTWTGLDEPWQEAFRQAWEALRTGNIAVGACASTTAGTIICSARNRVNDGEGPPGEIFGSALAHAETNVLARLPFRSRRDLVLTTTLQPCLQCAAAIRLGPVATVRLAGPDRPATSRRCGPWAKGRWWTWCTNSKAAARSGASRPWTSPADSDTCGPGSSSWRRPCPPEGWCGTAAAPAASGVLTGHTAGPVPGRSARIPGRRPRKTRLDPAAAIAGVGLPEDDRAAAGS